MLATRRDCSVKLCFVAGRCVCGVSSTCADSTHQLTFALCYTVNTRPLLRRGVAGPRGEILTFPDTLTTQGLSLWCFNIVVSLSGAGRSTAPLPRGYNERPHVAIDAQAARCQGRVLVLLGRSRPQEARWRFRHEASGGRGWRSARLSRRKRNTPLSALRSPARSRSSGSGGYFATRDELALYAAALE